MAVRISKLLKEANIGLSTMERLLKVLGIKENEFSLTSKVPDRIANLVLGFCYKDVDLLDLIELSAANKSEQTENSSNPKFPLKFVGRIDLEEFEKAKISKSNRQINTNRVIGNPDKQESISYNDNKNFWIEDLIILPAIGTPKRISIGDFYSDKKLPLYSVLIGCNGVGKSSIMKEIIDFFIDLQSCSSESDNKLPYYKGILRGIKYHIDGCVCEIIRFKVLRQFSGKHGGILP